MKARLRRTCWAALLAAAISTAGANTDGARAAYPGALGKVAFESTVNGDLEIFVVNADGSGATNLTNDSAAADTDPVFSPDGSRIVFVKNCGAPCGEGHPNIFVMNADGSGATNLTPGPFATGPSTCPDTNGGTGVNPTWSPDGSKIAYASNGEIVVMNADGSGKVSATCTSNAIGAVEAQPAWGANGQIAYVRAGDVWVMNSDGTGQHPLTATPAGEQNPDWSPDATKVAYTRGGEIWTMNASGTGQTAIVSGAGRTGALPAWSPDGTKIVFGSNAFTAPNGYDIFVMNPDGTGVTRLAGFVPAIETDPTWQPAAFASLPTVSIGDATVTEGNSGAVTASFVVSLSAPSSQPVTVGFATANDAAKAPADYGATTGTLTFAPGQTAQTIAVIVNGDALFELDEKFIVNLTGSTNATILDSRGVGMIRNDDPKPSLSIGDVSAAEGNAGTTSFVFVITLSAVSGADTKVRFATADGTATVAAGDYAAAGDTVTIPAGSISRAVVVRVNGDTLVEPDETFLFNLSQPVNATLADAQAIGTIVTDD